MSVHRHFDKICCVVLALSILITVLFMNSEKLGVETVSFEAAYKNTLFDTSKVHTIDIIMDNWEEFTQNCKSEEYEPCSVIIDGEAYKNVAIRGKGNTSLTQVDSYDNGRYSYKIEFDKYDSTKTYHGLDKICLNNIIQDNTYMKDYLAYRLMYEFGVASPLCSFVYITVNGEDWGLYLAIEAVEEAFLQRNYGNDYGELYKPDSMNIGGGKGNGREFDLNDLPENLFPEEKQTNENADFSNKISTNGKPADMIPEKPNLSENNGDNFTNGNTPFPDFDMSEKQNGMNFSSDDVLLKYTDDNFESYSNIFDNAKTDITDSDKTRLIQSLKNLTSNENISSTVDIQKVIKYFVVHNFVLNFDSYTGSMIHNYYLYEKDGVLQMIPWDYNLSFGGFNSNESAEKLINYPIDSPVSGIGIEERPMLAWIFANEEYKELYHKYFSEFISQFFDSGYFEDIMEETFGLISDYVQKDTTKFCTYDEFTNGFSVLKDFCLLRAKSIKAQLDGSIGSTDTTQETDTLISADGIEISAMGTMNNSFGGEMQNGKPQENNKKPFGDKDEITEEESFSQNENFSFEEESTVPTEYPDNDFITNEFNFSENEKPNFSPPDNNFENMSDIPSDMPSDIPSNFKENGRSENNFSRNEPDFSENAFSHDDNNKSPNIKSEAIMLLLSVVVLAVATVFVLLFPRRRKK